jgi:hypothetical protein
MGSLKATQHNKNLLAFIDKNINTKLIAFEITGAAHLIDRNNEYMVNNMTQGFIFSLIVIGILTFFLHRSWRMVLVFIIPNVIPLVLIGGIMGFAGIDINMGCPVDKVVKKGCCAALINNPELAKEWIEDEDLSKQKGNGHTYFQDTTYKNLLMIAENNLFKGQDLSDLNPSYNCSCTS